MAKTDRPSLHPLLTNVNTIIGIIMEEFAWDPDPKL
jgi:hypothetical protein